MPRIRTIKPEFWSSPDTAEASLIARLTYIGMWNWADDYGRGTLSLKELDGFIFPNDDVSALCVGSSDASEGSSYTFRDVVQEVVGTFGLIVYEVDRRTYYEIPTWEEHQRTERKAKSKYPAPTDGVDVTDQWKRKQSRKVSEVPTESVGSSDAMQGSSGIGTGEQGNRGTGEEKTPSTRNAYPEPFEQWYELYPRHVGKAAALKAWKQAVKKTSQDELNEATLRWAQAHEAAGTDPKFIPYPATWLNRAGWSDELPTPALIETGRKRTDLDDFLEATLTPAGKQDPWGSQPVPLEAGT
ncbi:hypothetical protein [Corynebacterium sp. MC3]|uniref:hypothetical protein n=1 Tax=Corynebacterium sp. MC3 TaxID=1720193 RepID=UPI0008D98AB1|nr:hypothetical protein [Corynebacterium sp. MC3]